MCLSASLRQGEDAARFSAGGCLAFLGILGHLERSISMFDPGILDQIIQALNDLLSSL